MVLISFHGSKKYKSEIAPYPYYPKGGVEVIDDTLLECRGLVYAHGALYAHAVAADVDDEGEFLTAVQAELGRMGVTARPICGRHQVWEGDRVQGFSLMLDGLTIENSLRILESGLGPHRRLGCGLFVAHRSAVAVVVPH